MLDVGKICAVFRVFQSLVCNCGFSSVWVTASLCSLGKGRPTPGIVHVDQLLLLIVCHKRPTMHPLVNTKAYSYHEEFYVRG